jgi:hypothetical protein
MPNPERDVAVEGLKSRGWVLLSRLRDGNNLKIRLFLKGEGGIKGARQTWVAIVDHLLGVAGVFVLREVGGGM